MARKVSTVSGIFSLYIFFVLYYNPCRLERVQYISTEHPAITYHNPKYMSYVNITSRRIGRGDPIHYVDLHFYVVLPIYNNFTADIYFYEFLSNEYRRSLVEMHSELCDLVQYDKLFGSGLKQGKFDQPCPYPAGAYDLYNMSIPLKHIPPHFPFTKGRIMAHVSSYDTKEIIVTGYIDMEIKEFNTKRRTKNGERKKNTN